MVPLAAAVAMALPPDTSSQKPATRPASAPASNVAETRTRLERIRLANGLRVVLMPLEESPHITITVVLPIGLCRDDQGHAVWSSLLAYLIRTTPGSPLTRETRGDTFADCTCLAFQRPTAERSEAVAILARWLSRDSFTDAAVRRGLRVFGDDLRRAIASGMTHPYAAAAWSQATRFGVTDIDIRNGLKRATPDDLIAYYKELLLADPGPLIVVAGKFDRQSLVAELERKIGSLTRPRAPATQSASSASRPGVPERITWDLPTSHVVFDWTIPDVSDHDFPHFLAASMGLMYWWNKFTCDYRIANTGVMIDPDVPMAAGRGFIVNTTLREPVDEMVPKPRADEEQTIGGLLGEDPQSRQFGQGRLDTLWQQLLHVPGRIAQAAQVGVARGVAELEATMYVATYEFRYAGRVPGFSDATSTTDDAAVRRVLERYLAPACRRELLILSRHAVLLPSTLPATSPGAGKQ